MVSYDIVKNISNLKKQVDYFKDTVYTKELEDTLPKDIYYSVNTPENPLVLSNLLRNFKDIPENIELDIFGEIYEFLLGKFALAEIFLTGFLPFSDMLCIDKFYFV